MTAKQEQDQGRQPGRQGNRIANLGRLAVAGLAIYGLARIAQEIPTPSDSSNNIPSIRRHIISQLDLGRNDPESFILDYRSAKIGFLQYANYNLNLDRSPGTIDEINLQRKGIVTYGVLIAQEVLPDESVRLEDHKVKIYDTIFNLDDEFDLYLADALVNQKLTTLLHKESGFEAEQKIQDLMWLKNHKLPVKFQRDTYILPDEEVLINLSRFYQTVVELGYPIPKNIDYGVNNKADRNTVVREGARFQAHENEVFSQDKFDTFVEQVKLQITSPYNERDSYINPGVLDNPNVSSNFEDYAETISRYFTDGVGFRRQLNLLWETGNPAYAVLRAKYDYVRLFFGGKEYLYGGQVFEPKVGDIFKISDPDPSRGPIYLRPEPVFVDNPDYPTVFDDYSARIVAGPVLVNTRSRGFRRMWKVESGFYYSGQAFDTNGSQGWISEDWLGAIEVHTEDSLPH
ncbi:MAG: hypothetical protein M1372_02760 [Patescibacteria group bacterium]|nr:hypothetical protein [Patescibacteria group bacterium]